MRGKTKLVLMFLALCLMLAIWPETASAAGGAVYVQGVDILSAENHTVQCGSGTAVYDPGTKTLRLENAAIGGSLLYGIQIDEVGVTVELIGENTVSAHFGIYSEQPFTIQGSGGRLSIDIVQDASIPGNPCRGIYARNGGLTAKNADIQFTTAPLNANSAYAIDSWGGVNQIINSTIQIDMQPLRSPDDTCIGINIPEADASLAIIDSSITMGSLDRGISSSGALNISGSGFTIANCASHAVIAQDTMISNGSVLDISAQDGQAIQAAGKKITISNSSANLVSTGTNGIFCRELEIIDSSKVSAKGFWPALFVEEKTVIKNSYVDSETANDVGIFCKGPVEIADSEVEAVSSLGQSGILVLGDLDVSGSDITASGNAGSNSISAAGNISITGGKTEIGEGGIASSNGKIHIGGIILSNGTPSYDNIGNGNGDVSYSEADYSEVDAAIKEAEVLKKEDYTNFEIVEKALQDVVRGKLLCEQDVVDGYAAAIRAAISALIPVPPVEQITYTILEGADQTVTRGENDSVTIRADGDFDKFVSVAIDDSELAKDHYTAAAGSTIITLKPEYINTLTEGDHTVKIHYTDGLAQTILTLQEEEATEPEKPPVTPPDEPDPEPSEKPEPEPSESPEPEPSESPEPEPSESPEPEPSESPEPEPSESPEPEPSESPEPEPSESPEPEPSESPEPEPSESANPEPSENPDSEPSDKPDEKPGEQPGDKPDEKPTVKPDNGSSDSSDKAPSPQSTKLIAPKTGDNQPFIWYIALAFFCSMILTSKRWE